MSAAARTACAFEGERRPGASRSVRCWKGGAGSRGRPRRHSSPRDCRCQAGCCQPSASYRGWPARPRRGSMPGFRQGQEGSSPAPPLPARTTRPPAGPRASQLATRWPLEPWQVNLPEAVLREGDPGRGPETSNSLGLSASRITVLPPSLITRTRRPHTLTFLPKQRLGARRRGARRVPGQVRGGHSARIPLPAPAPGPPLRQWPQAHGARGERALPPADHPASERGPGRPG